MSSVAVSESKLAYSEKTEAIIGACIEVHRHLGPGLLESTYEACLAHEFATRGIPFRRQVDIPVVYKGEKIDCGFRADFLVYDEILVELKAVEKTIPIHEAQLLTQMKLTTRKVGLLVNFNVTTLTNGVTRRVL
jgi:GxxExxY protein